jgi:peptidyl-prolyl cis-trans isomerase B (cyclophilin B)
LARARWLLLAAAALLAGCGSSKHAATTGSTRTATAPPGCTAASPPKPAAKSEPKPSKPLDPAKTYAVTLKTNCGTVGFDLAVKTSPHTTASFVSLVRRGFFDGTIFHRIAVGFVIQGGDPTATGTGGPGYLTLDRPPRSTRYTHGVVAMGKTTAQPAGTAGSQFFIVTAADAGLPPDYAVLGKVTKGLDVVDRIGKLGDANQQPTALVEIERASVAVR